MKNYGALLVFEYTSNTILSENLNQSNACDEDKYGAILFFEYTIICTIDINVQIVAGQHETFWEFELEQFDLDIYEAILIFEYTSICTKNINVQLFTGQHDTFWEFESEQSDVDVGGPRARHLHVL